MHVFWEGDQYKAGKGVCDHRPKENQPILCPGLEGLIPGKTQHCTYFPTVALAQNVKIQPKQESAELQWRKRKKEIPYIVTLKGLISRTCVF